MPWDYYLQTDSTQGVRRYPTGSQIGERWDRSTRLWSTQCADRRSCALTHDRPITPAEAAARTSPEGP